MHFLGLEKEEKLLVPHSEKKTIELLKYRSSKPSRKNAKLHRLIWFNGNIDNNRFNFSQNSTYPQYFIPFIQGEIIEGEAETLIKLKFKLFRGAKIFLVLWSGIFLLSALFCVLFLKHYNYALIALVLLVLNYLLVHENFKMHYKKSYELFKSIFSENG